MLAVFILNFKHIHQIKCFEQVFARWLPLFSLETSQLVDIFSKLATEISLVYVTRHISSKSSELYM